MNGDQMIKVFARGHWIIRRQTDGLTHADSLLQLPFWDNNLNWVLGHILFYRDKVLRLLGESALLTDEESAPYRRESEPLRHPASAVDLKKLLASADSSQEALEAALRATKAAQFATVHDEDSGQTVAERIEFIQWHETYHLGQLEILRQLAGTNDSII
jgi:uncharacterized damage-inducible protein DinB